MDKHTEQTQHSNLVLRFTPVWEYLIPVETSLDFRVIYIYVLCSNGDVYRDPLMPGVAFYHMDARVLNFRLTYRSMKEDKYNG